MRRLQSVRLHWWLGRRLLRAPGQRWALSALALTSTLSALLILGLSAVPDVLHDRQDAEAARTVTDTGKSTGVAALTSTWDWRGEQPIHLLRIGVEAESMANAAHLPGVPQPPMPDEVWLSPQLAQDLARDPVLRKAFPQRVVGTIDESVLPTSQDRVAYVGVDPKSLTERGIHATQSIGADAAEFQTSSRTLLLLGGATLALFVGVPLAAVFVAAFGLLAQPRQRQVRLLEALGAKPRRARVLVCADGIVAGLLGTAVAWLLFETLSRAITHIPFTPAQWTAGHPDIKFTGALLSLLTPLAAAVWAAWRLDARVTNGRLLSRRAGPHLSTIPLPPLFAAIGLIAVLASARVRADSSPLATAAVVTAVALSALSAPATIAWAQRAIGMALLRSTRLNATTLIAGARLARVTPRGSRTASMLVPAFVVALAVAPVIGQVAPRDTATEELNQRTGRVVAFMSPVPDAGTQERIRNLPGVLAVSGPHTNLEKQSQYSFACSDFKRLLARDVCTIGARASALDLPPDLSASFPYGAGLDDGGVVGEPVDDRGAQAGVGEGLGPAAEGFVGRDCDGGLLFAFGEDLEEEFGAAPVELEVAQFIQTEQVDPAVAGDDFGEGSVVLGFGELVDEPGGEDVADPVAGFGGGGPEPDQQVRLPGAGVADQAQRSAFGDPFAAWRGC
jgi:hypothetical protein